METSNPQGALFCLFWNASNSPVRADHKHHCLLSVSVAPSKNNQAHTPKGNLNAGSRAGLEDQHKAY